MASGVEMCAPGEMKIDAGEVSKMLSCFLSPKAETRQMAEHMFVQAQSAKPNELIQALLAVMGENPDSCLRQQAAVTLRTAFREFLLHRSDAIWNSLTEHTRGLLKEKLVRALQQESVRVVRNSVCDTTADLSRRLIPLGIWSELPGVVLGLLGSEEPALCTAGFKLMTDLSTQLKHFIEQNNADILTVAAMAARAPDPDLRLVCLGFVAALLESCSRRVWRSYESLLPIYLEDLKQLIVQQKVDAAGHYLVKFVEIGENGAAYFQSNLPLLLQSLFAIARDGKMEDSLRQMSTEVMLTMVCRKPKMCLKTPEFLPNLVATLMELMLTVVDDADWIDQDDPVNDDDELHRNYDVGEAGLDRLGSYIPGDQLMAVVYKFVPEYLRVPEWQYKLAGIMAIAQTVEYLPEEAVETHLEEITSTIVHLMKDEHYRVRYAACHAIGQIALDHRPYFQKTYFTPVLSAISETLEDSVPRIQAHAMSALINFAEECTKEDLRAFCEPLMVKLFERTNASQPRKVREQAVTAIAVVAGVMEKEFLKYYGIVVPVLKHIISEGLTVEERTLRGKAVECISIIGLAVGMEAFEQDAHEIVRACLHIAGTGLQADDPVKEYIQEACCRMCRTMKEAFLPYLPTLLGDVFKILSVKPDLVDMDEQENEEIMIVSIQGERYSGLKATVVDDMTQALALLDAFLEVLGPHFGDHLRTALQVLLPLLDFNFNEDLKRSALNCIAELFSASRRLHETTGGVNPVLAVWLAEVAEKVFRDVESLDSDLELVCTDMDAVISEVGGLVRCIRGVGTGVLMASGVASICKKVLDILQAARDRRAESGIGSDDDEYEDAEGDDSSLLDAQNSEQSLMSTLLQIVSALMTVAPAEVLQSCTPMLQKFMETYLQPSSPTSDHILGLYVADDVLELLQERGSPLWPSFANRLVELIADSDADVRQTACFGIVHAAKCQQFPADLISMAAPMLATILKDPNSKSKAQIVATDNAVAAVGAIVLSRPAVLAGSLEQYVKLWIDSMPLKSDDEEGRRVHGELVELLRQQNIGILGANKENLQQLVGICASIYRTSFSTAKTDEGIRQFLQMTGFDVISSLGKSFDAKQRKGLELAHQDFLAQAAAS